MQRIIVLALLVVLVSSFTGLGVLGEPWNEFDTIVQKLGWGEDNVVSPTMDASLELRLIQIDGPGGPTPSALNIFEDFEAGFSSWGNTGGDDNNCWRQTSSPTPTMNTGPISGADGTTSFVFYESSNGCSPGTGQQAFLLGSIIDFDAFNNVEVIFWRHMWDGAGADNMGRLSLQLEDSTGSGTFTEVWFNEGNQGNQWDQFTVDLSAADVLGGQRQLRFVATETVAGRHSDMAVDQILIQGVAAPTIINFEDFETGFTTWLNTGGDDNNCWRHRNSPTPTGTTGPSVPAPNTGAPSPSQPLGTEWYVFYEASNGCSPGAQQAFLLYDTTINFAAFNNVEVIFWRHMWDGEFGQMGRLALELEDSMGSGTFSEVWFQQGTQGNQWDQITVDLSSEDNTGERQIRFVATETTGGIHSDMAVDEITIQGTLVPTGINLINSCVFSSTDSIPAGTGLSQGVAICKLLNAPADQGGVPIAEGRTTFDSYAGAPAEIEVFITQKIFENSNNNELIFDVQFIIEAPI